MSADKFRVNQELAVFEPKDWFNKIGPVEPDAYGNWVTRDVIGPRDACRILHLRDLLRPHLSFGPPSPTDVFLLSLGDDSPRHGTKIGGLPYWPRGRVWPLSITGAPLPFLSQFCFSSSTDMVGTLPGDILLLFGEANDPSSFVAHWESFRNERDWVTRDEIPVRSALPCFSGARWRTDNYPDAAFSGEVSLDDGATASDIPLVCQLLGMQIGSHPFLPPWHAPPPKMVRVICSMCSLFPIPDRIYPFMNQSRPLTVSESQQLAVRLTDIEDADGFGVVIVGVTDSGEPTIAFENL